MIQNVQPLSSRRNRLQFLPMRKAPLLWAAVSCRWQRFTPMSRSSPRHSEPEMASAGATGATACFVEQSVSFAQVTKRTLLPSGSPHSTALLSKLQAGAGVADVGCGYGASTLIMADAFPKSCFLGIDFHDGSIVEARKSIGSRANVDFKAARAEDFRDAGFDLVTIFDALHDMGDPVGVARTVRETLKAEGTLMVVEPLAGDALPDNLNPVGRVFYAFSTSVCVPASLNQEGRMALGAQAGEARLRDVLREGGFTRIRRALETPFNMVIEARI